MHRYNPLVFAGLVTLCILGFVLVGIASDLPHFATPDQVLNAVGESLLVADMVLVLLADWRGFLTLNGHLNWSSMAIGKRMLFGILYCVFGPILLILYFIQVARYKAPPSPEVAEEVQQYMRDGDLDKLKQRITGSLH